MTPATREQLRQLAEPLAPADLEWRVQQAGEKNGKPWAKVLAYVTNRAIMQRLDDIVGAENWRNEYRASPGAKEGGVLCGLSIRVASAVSPDGEWVTKWDGADETDIEPTKGGLSGSMKRAAVQWGIGRQLYDLEDGWAQIHDGGRFSAKTKEGKWFKWDPPALPEWAIPKPRHVTTEQLARIETLVGLVRDERVAAGVRKRIVGGLTESAADDAIRFLEARVADASAAAQPSQPARGEARQPSNASNGTAARQAAGAASESEMTLEQAKALPLTGTSKNWNGKGGQPLGSLPRDFLENARTWYEQKAREDADKGLAPRADRAAQIEAITLVLEDLDSAQGDLPLDEPIAAPAPGEKQVAAPAPGHVAAAIDPAAAPRAKRNGKPTEKQPVSIGAEDAEF